ncbi:MULTISPECIES: PqiC family protein [Pseudomonas]|uniref:PqiC family protein n=1 Tax=Pseudomonas TaxID=286 RepID=UPI00257FD9EE|nr:MULTISPECIES: ABC-type transport auxiliary lipoprotein family protein [Pseudomonas]
MTLVRVSRLFFLTALLGLGGCMSKTPAPLYQLDSGSPAIPQKASGPAVLLGPIQLAEYLSQDNLLQRQADGSLLADRDARWAGRLSANVDDVLLRQLAGRLNSQRVALAPAIGFSADVQAQLNITRLDSGPTQPAVLEAQWRLVDKAGQLRDTRLVRLQEEHQGSAADQVRAQGVLLQRLAGEMAETIGPLSRQLAESARKAEARAATATKEKPSRIPVAEPVRNGAEVFRF